MLSALAVVFAVLASPALAAEAPVVRSFNASTYLVTMFAHDPQSSAVDLLSALSGGVNAGFTQFNSNSDITYGIYGDGYLVSGVQGGDQAAFVDLGTYVNLIGKDYCQTVGDGQYFASIHVSEGQIVAVDTCGSSNSCPQTFHNISGLAQTLTKTQTSAKAYPIPGHIYILRIANWRDQTTRALFKLLVVNVGHGNSSVTFRYGILDHNQTARVDCCNEKNDNICASAPRNLLLEQGPIGPRGPALPTAAPMPYPSTPPSAPQQPGASTGEVAGTAAGSVAATLLVMGGIWFCVGKRRGAMGQDDAERALVR